MSATGHHVLSLLVTIRATPILARATAARTARAETAEANGFEGIVVFVVSGSFEGRSPRMRLKHLLTHYEQPPAQYIFLPPLHNLLFFGGHKSG
jgi:hypothetical protein